MSLDTTPIFSYIFEQEIVDVERFLTNFGFDYLIYTTSDKKIWMIDLFALGKTEMLQELTFKPKAIAVAGNSQKLLTISKKGDKSKLLFT